MSALPNTNIFSNNSHDHNHGHNHDSYGATSAETRTMTSPESYQQDDEEAERLHFLKVARTYASYANEHVNHFVYKRLRDVSEDPTSAHPNLKLMGPAPLHKVSESHRKILKDCGFFERHYQIEECIKKNQLFLNEVIRDVMQMFQNDNPLKLHSDTIDMDSSPSSGDSFLKSLFSHTTAQAIPTPSDFEKIRTTLRQFVRDWSVEGTDERAHSYSPIIDEINRKFKNCGDRSKIDILVPGAGLGRLAFELAALGYRCQGSEWSVFMLYASSFILNHTLRAKQFTIYPWATQPCNQFSLQKQCRPVQIPDVNPRDCLTTDSISTNAFSMSAGDFLEVYSKQENSWDCIASCFFLDTARNVIEYLELMFTILKPGGCLINLGPLLYHFTDMPGELSIELTFEELVSVMESIGFEIEKIDHSHHSSSYLDNSSNMLNYFYKTPLFVAVKPITTSSKSLSVDAASTETFTYIKNHNPKSTHLPPHNTKESSYL